MSSNICGNCANFKPKPGEKFFNCTKATQAGIKYGMQVRPDTRSCEAFEPLKPPSLPKPAPKPVKASPQIAARLCPWGRLILLAAILLIILLLSWGIYTCAKQSIEGGPTPTPTSTSTPEPTSTQPTPTPIPPYIYQDCDIGSWAEGANQSVFVWDPVKSSTFTGAGGVYGAPVGTEFVWFQFTVSNINISKLTIGPGSFWVTDSVGRSYFAAGQPVYYPLRYDAKTIYPGGTMRGIIPYIVPTYASGLRINYMLNPSTVPPTVARWKLPW